MAVWNSGCDLAGKIGISVFLMARPHYISIARFPICLLQGRIPKSPIRDALIDRHRVPAPLLDVLDQMNGIPEAVKSV